MRLSIRYKILGVLGLLLLAAVGSYTLLASLIFREEKVALLYDINHSIAVNTASQLRATLMRTADHLKLFVVSQALTERSELRLPSQFLKEAGIKGTRVFKKAPEGFAEMKLPPEVPTPSLEKTQLTRHLKEAADNQLSVWSSGGEAEKRYFVATRIELNVTQQNHLYVALAELEPKVFYDTLQSAGPFKAYLAQRDGEVLVHVDRNTIAPASSIAHHPLLKVSEKQGTATGFQSFRHGNEDWYGAFAPVGIGNLVFLSQANRSEVTSALRTLIEESLLFGLIVVTLTFIASILFSKRLTRNLGILTAGARQIGAGDLDSRIEIRSRDEVEELAASFNAMVEALKSSREAIEKYNRELEDKVALRTQQLKETNAAIKEVQEKLLKTTQLAAVGEVAGRTAHEVLNPLTAIVSRIERSRMALKTSGETLPGQFSEIVSAWEADYQKGGMQTLTEALQSPSSVHAELNLFEEDLDNLKKLSHFWQKQQEVVAGDLEFVSEQTARIHRIIDRMREMGRLAVKSDVHCQEALKEACSTMSDFLSKHKIELKEELGAGSDLAILNRDELIQIVTNLMRNSFHAIGSRDAETAARDPGRIVVRTTSSNHLLLVDIIDNGVGVPEDRKEMIFEQGFTTKSPEEGTGLGLAICRRYAHAFSGEVEMLYSEPGGRGTCFRVTIPLKDESDLAVAV